jgi:shikimate dehydrogenase
LAVIGDPVGHSLSPRIQMAALSAAGLRGNYEAIRVTADDLPAAISSMREAGFDGFNVTIPHKEAMIQLVDKLDSLAAETGAVNTVKRVGRALVGYNTDVTGFGRLFDRLVLIAENRVRDVALVLGAGGASRATVASLQTRGWTVVIANRTIERAIRAYGLGTNVIPLDAREIQSALDTAGVVVNTTSVGMGTVGESPLPRGVHLDSQITVCDLVYNPLETALLRHARKAHCPTVDGLEFLIAQAADSFYLWTGCRADELEMRPAAGIQRVVTAVAAS